LIAGLKVAVTVALEVSVTEQVEVVPVQAPLHPAKAAKVVAGPGVSVSVTAVLAANEEEQVVGQLIPEGELVTVPDEVPLLLTVS
jgi:hypothetical protein